MKNFTQRLFTWALVGAFAASAMPSLAEVVATTDSTLRPPPPGWPWGPRPGPRREQRTEIHCKSEGHKYRECGIGGGFVIEDVQVGRQRSDADCREGRSFGITNRRDAIWVDQGCEADFEVWYRR